MARLPPIVVASLVLLRVSVLLSITGVPIGLIGLILAGVAVRTGKVTQVVLPVVIGSTREQVVEDDLEKEKESRPPIPSSKWSFD
jgi:hypothetical protein